MTDADRMRAAGLSEETIARADERGRRRRWLQKMTDAELAEVWRDLLDERERRHEAARMAARARGRAIAEGQ